MPLLHAPPKNLLSLRVAFTTKKTGKHFKIKVQKQFHNIIAKQHNSKYNNIREATFQYYKCSKFTLAILSSKKTTTKKQGSWTVPTWS